MEKEGPIGWAAGRGGVLFELIKQRESYADKDMC